jgi:hypothetical protein
MDHNPSGGAGRSGRPVAAGPDQRPDQEALFAPEEVLPRGTPAGAAVGPVVPGPAPALDLDAVSDYVPAPDDGLAMDYGPVPDNDAARDYAKALGYDAPPAPAPEPAPALHLAPAPRLAAVHLAPAQPQDPVPGPDAAVTPDSAQAPGPPAPAAQAHAPATAARVPPTSAPGPPAPAHVPAAADHVPPAGDVWAPGQVAGPVSPATYWRRRLVALVAGIVALTLLVWVVSGVLKGTGRAAGHGGKPSAGPSAAHGRPGAAHGHTRGSSTGQRRAGRSGHTARGNAPGALPEPPAGRARTITAMAGHRASGSLSGVSDVLTMAGARQERGSAASGTPHRPVARAPEHRAVTRPPGPHVPACGRGDVVLSLVSPRYWYQRGRWPLFGVDAVSTASGPCRFNMGSRHATVVVSSGRARVWGSADCAHGTGSQSVVLSRGVPAVRWIYWDRAISSPGCPPPHLPVGQGAYTAIAFDGQLSSQVLVFILGRPGTSPP